MARPSTDDLCSFAENHDPSLFSFFLSFFLLDVRALFKKVYNASTGYLFLIHPPHLGSTRTEGAGRPPEAYVRPRSATGCAPKVRSHTGRSGTSCTARRRRAGAGSRMGSRPVSLRQAAADAVVCADPRAYSRCSLKPLVVRHGGSRTSL